MHSVRDIGHSIKRVDFMENEAKNEIGASKRV